MSKELKTLGLITARGGSKSIPFKNISPLGGIPLIAYTIESARESELLDRCIVSTDSERIAGICREWGLEVPFMRPPELAQDNTPSFPVVLHALDAVGESYDAVMILQPTSPFRTGDDIDTAIRMLIADPEADSVISVVKVDDRHPARMKRIEDGVLIDPPFTEAFEGQPRQQLPDYYVRNGAVYLSRVQSVRETQLLKGRRSLAYVMPPERSVNIDGYLDLLLSEAVLRERKKAAEHLHPRE